MKKKYLGLLVFVLTTYTTSFASAYYTAKVEDKTSPALNPKAEDEFALAQTKARLTCYMSKMNAYEEKALEALNINPVGALDENLTDVYKTYVACGVAAHKRWIHITQKFSAKPAFTDLYNGVYSRTDCSQVEFECRLKK